MLTRVSGEGTLQPSQLQMLGVIWGLGPCSCCYLFKPFEADLGS